jgi:dephospho-CoA kinase
MSPRPNSRELVSLRGARRVPMRSLAASVARPHARPRVARRGARALPERPAASASPAPSPPENTNTMLVLGLTGGIGMGKSFVTDALRALDVPVLDSDASVHALYAPGGGAVAAVRGAFGDEVIGPDGGVDRAALSKKVLGDTETHRKNMKTLESLVHPLVDSKRDAFLKQAALDKHAFVVLDIPLLFEKKYEKTVDGVLVVSAGEEKQRERCLQREGMTETKLKNIVARQTPDAEKIAKADVVIDTACSKEETLKQVESLVMSIRAGQGGFRAKTFVLNEAEA